MYETFFVGDVRIKPYLMDHSAFDASAFEFSVEGKILLYSGDFRGHGRKAVCLDRFIENAPKQADILLTEGTMLGRADEAVLTENEVEQAIVEAATGIDAPILFQCSSQNIDRLVSFYRAALRLGKLFVVDVYTANVLYELRSLGNHLPFPSGDYPNMRVFFPYRLTRKIFEQVGEEYARRFSAFHISKEELMAKCKNVLMTARPSMWRDIEKCELKDGLFLYSMWNGYRDTEYQQKFEASLLGAGFACKAIHTSGHASVPDIQRLMTGLNPKRIIPIHTMVPNAFLDFSDKVMLQEDGNEFEV
jgi:ribonuclease J